MRSEKELLIATRQFATENKAHSWWALWSTLVPYFLTLAICFSDAPYPIRILSSLLSGLLVVRVFVIYHDFQHRAILDKSTFASLILNVYGLLVLSPPSVWNRSHNHHHKNNSKELANSVGSFPTMSCEQFSEAS